jgi:hypothetical protein
MRHTDYECQIEKDLEGNDHKLKGRFLFEHLPDSKIMNSLSDIRNGCLPIIKLECDQ